MLMYLALVSELKQKEEKILWGSLLGEKMKDVDDRYVTCDQTAF